MRRRGDQPRRQHTPGNLHGGTWQLWKCGLYGFCHDIGNDCSDYGNEHRHAGGPFCQNEPATVTITGTTGAPSLRQPVLNISPTTGAINLAASTTGTCGDLCPATETADV